MSEDNEVKVIDLINKVAPDIALLLSYLTNFQMKSRFLLDVINQVYKVSKGSGSGKVSIVIEDHRIRSVHGIENRWIDDDVFLG